MILSFQEEKKMSKYVQSLEDAESSEAKVRTEDREEAVEEGHRP